MPVQNNGTLPIDQIIIENSDKEASSSIRRVAAFTEHDPIADTGRPNWSSTFFISLECLFFTIYFLPTQSDIL